MNTKPSILLKIRNFFKALYQHIKTGMKKCSQKEVDKRYDICMSCDFFETIRFDQIEAVARCNYCGCSLSNNKKYFLNKLAWKDQKCPINKW